MFHDRIHSFFHPKVEEFFKAVEIVMAIWEKEFVTVP